MAGFMPLKEAAAMKEGLRVTGVPGLPGIWIVAVKNLYHAKKVPVIHVAHPTGDQEELYQLTAQRSNPTSWWADEAPRSSWLEQLHLAERLGSGPQLVPEDPAARAEVIGLCHLALGSPGGLAYEKRNIMMGNSSSPFAIKYKVTDEMIKLAPQRTVALLNHVHGVLEKQKAKGSNFLVGSSVTAADICWASALVIVAPPGEELLPRHESGKGLIGAFGQNPPEVQSAITPLILEHQQLILGDKELSDIPSMLEGTTNSYS
ncbi:unnamed protein product [Symbiodinium natans]|uniref:Glutathione S-transferase C-terminal domain-containing protein n=1 Tax=Symbiodinium natans TaxID=878477 RepID=A0A812MM71_9DINO|nr:unnamed protein product [Symbiodinium natans]